MTIAKIIAILISVLNSYLGIRFFLNVINVLQSSKYSPTSNVIFSILFLGLGIAGLYFSIIKNDIKWSLWMTAAPWVLGLIILFITMITSDYK